MAHGTTMVHPILMRISGLPGYFNQPCPLEIGAGRLVRICSRWSPGKQAVAVVSEGLLTLVVPVLGRHMESDQLKDEATQSFTLVTTSESSFFLIFLVPRFHQALYTSGFPCLSAGCRWSGRRWQPRWSSETRNHWELAACCYRGPQATPTSPPPEWGAGRMVQATGKWATLCRRRFGKRWADWWGAEWPVRCLQPAMGAWPKPIDTRTRLQNWLRRGEEAVQQGGHEWWLPL